MKFKVAPSIKEHNSLREFPIPINGKSQLPEKNYSFQGVTVDYDAENKNCAAIGTGGEELVIFRERKILTEHGLPELAAKVKKVQDGEGYDILSFALDGSPKFIEVKTTTGINTRPFYMSDNEWQFMMRNADNYELHRIYAFDKSIKTGNFFCIKGDLTSVVFTRRSQIEVFIK